MTLVDNAKKLHELKTKKEELQANLSELEKQLKSVESDLVSTLQEQGMNRVDVAGIGSFSLTTRRFFQIENRDELIDFLHKNGDEDLLTVNHNTLNSYAKELKERALQKGDEEFVIPGTKEFVQTKIQVRKGKN